MIDPVVHAELYKTISINNGEMQSRCIGLDVYLFEEEIDEFEDGVVMRFPRELQEAHHLLVDVQVTEDDLVLGVRGVKICCTKKGRWPIKS